MNTEKDNYLEEQEIGKQYDSNEDSSLNPKELLLISDGKKRKNKYIYCILSIIFFILGYLICYLLNVKEQPKIEKSEIEKSEIENPKIENPKIEQTKIEKDLPNNITIDLEPHNEKINEKLLKEIEYK